MLSEPRVVLCLGSLDVNGDITAVGQEGSDIADCGGTRDRWFLPFIKPFSCVFVDIDRRSIAK